MAEVARSSFNTQLASVMESLLAAAVCEISRIFEGSLSDSRAEVERSREEVVLLKRKLEALEGQLKEANSIRDMGTGVTFDPSSFTLPPDTGLMKAACPQQGLEDACLVKAEPEVMELEPVSFTQGDAEVHQVGFSESDAEKDVKEEFAGGDPEPLSVEVGGAEVPGVTSHLHPASETSLEAVADGAVRWRVIPGAGPGPALAQKCEEAEPRPFPSRPHCVATRRGGVAGYGARTRLRPAPRTGHAHRPAPDHAHRPASDHAHRPASDHAHRPAPDHALSSPPPQCLSSNGWAGETRLPGPPAHSPPEAGLGRSAHPAALSTPPPAPRPPCPAAKARLKHLSALARERPHGCPYCGKAFFYPSQQRRHLLRHTGERLFPCALCEKSFVTPSERSVHVRVHTGEKPYACLQCGKRFNRTGNLRAHERDVHLRNRPFSCAACGKTFAQKGNLRTHQQRVHQAPRPAPSADMGGL